MDPKEKKVKEEELNVEETLNNAEEQPQDEQADDSRRGIGKGTGDGSGDH